MTNGAYSADFRCPSENNHASLELRPDECRDGCDRRLPFLKRAVSILQLWCILNVCKSMVDLHESTLGTTEGNMAKKAKKAKKTKKTAKKKKK
jgi:hypothetical protein